jgi:hypothetical protein
MAPGLFNLPTQSLVRPDAIFSSLWRAGSRRRRSPYPPPPRNEYAKYVALTELEMARFGIETPHARGGVEQVVHMSVGVNRVADRTIRLSQQS